MKAPQVDRQQRPWLDHPSCSTSQIPLAMLVLRAKTGWIPTRINLSLSVVRVDLFWLILFDLNPLFSNFSSCYYLPCSLFKYLNKEPQPTPPYLIVRYYVGVTNPSTLSGQATKLSPHYININDSIPRDRPARETKEGSQQKVPSLCKSHRQLDNIRPYRLIIDSYTWEFQNSTSIITSPYTRYYITPFWTSLASSHILVRSWPSTTGTVGADSHRKAPAHLKPSHDSSRQKLPRRSFGVDPRSLG